MESKLAFALVLLSAGCGSDRTVAPVARPIPPPAAPPQLVVAESSRSLRVLYVEDEPRWEYRFIKNALIRDAGLRAQVLLLSASAGYRQEHSEGVPSLEALPLEPRQLFAYDVVMLGDVLPAKLAPTPAAATAWLELLVEFVDDGGGLVLMCGDRAMPEAYRGTPLESVLPVALERQPQVSVRREYRPQLAAPAQPHALVTVWDEPEYNERFWHQELPPLVSHYPVAELRDGATGLLFVPADEANGQQRRVLAAVGRHKLGRVFFLATDETWRWRATVDGGQDLFWHNVICHLARRE